MQTIKGGHFRAALDDIAVLTRAREWGWEGNRVGPRWGQCASEWADRKGEEYADYRRSKCLVDTTLQGALDLNC